MAEEETHKLISSDRVEDTRVYDLQGNDIGGVDKLMLEKRSGRVAYAVIRFGDFFGFGGETYPLPWEKLTYDEALDGYHLHVSRQQIEGAPKTPSAHDEHWTPEKGQTIYTHYAVQPYWTIPPMK